MVRTSAGLLPFLVLSCLSAPAAPAGTRISIEVSAGGVERRDRPVEVELDLRESAAAVRIEETDVQGRVIDRAVPGQLERDPEGKKATLVFLLKGVTPPDGVRHYRATLGQAPEGLPAPLVEVTDDLFCQGQSSYRIATPSAAWIYHKQGAGFASLEDRDGRDWLSYRPSGGSAGNYRGVPNAVHPEGHFHPGGTGCTSVLVSRGPVRARILSGSADRKWACAWDVFPHFARLTVLRKEKPYWFLYEGTPGGKLEPEKDYCVRSSGERTPLSAKWQGDLPAPEWVYFGDGALDRVLWLAHHEDDDKVDSYWPMEGNMTVFGFGRNGLQKFLDRAPDRFSIGLCESADPAAVARAIRGATSEPTVKAR
jgi:hypothetical protein